MDKGTFQERREFLRYRYDKPIGYRIISSPRGPDAASSVLGAIASNLSASGVLFSSKYIPEISSIIVLDMDYRTTRICREIEENALIVKNKIVGKVVRIEDSEDGLYDVGVAFIKASERLPKDVESLIK